MEYGDRVVAWNGINANWQFIGQNNYDVYVANDVKYTSFAIGSLDVAEKGFKGRPFKEILMYIGHLTGFRDVNFESHPQIFFDGSRSVTVNWLNFSKNCFESSLPIPMISFNGNSQCLMLTFIQILNVAKMLENLKEDGVI